MTEQNKSSLKKIYDRIVHGFTNEMDILGHPITENSWQRNFDTPQFKFSILIVVLNSVITAASSTGDAKTVVLMATMGLLGASNINIDQMATFRRKLPTSNVINKDPTDLEIMKYGSASVAEADKINLKHGNDWLKLGISGFSATELLVFMNMNPAFLKSMTGFYGDNSSAYTLFVAGAGYASGSFSALLASEWGLVARLDRLREKKWVLQPPGTAVRKIEKKSIFGKTREILVPASAPTPGQD